MKTIRLLILAMAISAATSFASAQTTFDVENPIANKYEGKLWYGAAFRTDMLYLMQEQNGAVLSFGYMFPKRHYLGLQTGWTTGWYNEFLFGTVEDKFYFHGIPVLVEYAYYIPMFRHKIASFFVGAEVGTTLPVSVRPANPETPKYVAYELMANIKVGLDFRLFKKFNAFATFDVGFFSGAITAGVRF